MSKPKPPQPITWDQFDKLTRTAPALRVWSLTIDRGEQAPGESAHMALGRVIVRHPRDGSGRLTAIVHLWGASAFSASVSGFGYDKTGAATAGAMLAACRWIVAEADKNGFSTDPQKWRDNHGAEAFQRVRFAAAMLAEDSVKALEAAQSGGGQLYVHECIRRAGAMPQDVL